MVRSWLFRAAFLSLLIGSFLSLSGCMSCRCGCSSCCLPCLGRPIACGPQLCGLPSRTVGLASPFSQLPEPAPLTVLKPLPKPPEIKNPFPFGGEPLLSLPAAPAKPSLQPAPNSEASRGPSEPAKPELVLSKSGPERRYLGKEIEHTLVVKNQGTAPATNVELVDQLPRQLQLDEVPAGATASGQAVRWQLGEIPPEGDKTVTIKTRAAGPGPRLLNRATVTSREGAGATATAAVEVFGSSALLLEAFDLADPLPIDGESEYLVRVTNQGSLPTEELHVRVECSAQLIPLSVTGGRPEAIDGQAVHLPSFRLSPAASRTFRFKARAVNPGDARVRVLLSGPDLRAPVIEEESTTVYAAR